MLTTVRRRLLKRSGPGGVVALHRAFTVLDDNHNRSLDAEELRQAAQMVGLDLTPAETKQLIDAIDKDHNGQVSITEFLRFLRGDLPKVRATVVKTAFEKLDRSGNGVVDLEDLRQIYDVDRHPEVLRKTKTKDQVLLEFLHIFASDEAAPITQLTLDDFLNYYAGISAEIDRDEDFHTLVTRSWQLDQIQVGRSADLAPHIMDGFRCSAYWEHPGCGIDKPPAAPGVVLQNAQLPLEPFPLPKAGYVDKSAQSFFDTASKTHHKTLTRSATQLVLPPPQTHSTLGAVKTDPRSRGFMVTQSTTKRTIGQGAFDDDVMSAYDNGRTRELYASERRMNLAHEPFVTAEPASYERSSQIHAPLLKAVNRELPANPRTTLDAYGTDDDLRAVLEAQREALRSNLTLGKWKGGVPMSTTQSHFQPIDPRVAVAANDRLSPVFIGNNVAPPPFESKGRNGYDTEYSTNMLDRTAEAERVSKYNTTGMFKLVNGIPQLKSSAHHPRSPLGSQAKLAPSAVVPNMFASTTHTLHR